MRKMAIVGIGFTLFGWCLPGHSTEAKECNSVEGSSLTSTLVFSDAPLPERAGPRVKTSGRVPHVQVGLKPVSSINEDLYRLAFDLPGLEEHFICLMCVNNYFKYVMIFLSRQLQ